MYKSLSAPLVVQLEITEQCPNQCVHCYNFWRHSQAPNNSVYLESAQIDHIIQELEQSRVFQVVITGGEPFLNKQGLYQILDRVEAGGFLTATLNSSLLGMTKTDAQKLIRYKCLTGVLTSLMGPSAEVHDGIAGRRGSFEQTVAGIKMLRRFQVPVSVNMVISKLNQYQIKATAVLCQDLGVKVFNATRATCPTNCFRNIHFALHGWLHLALNH
jgi:MoaA/NifB/PqqE/SkfB family radical SAM enzyme